MNFLSFLKFINSACSQVKSHVVCSFKRANKRKIWARSKEECGYSARDIFSYNLIPTRSMTVPWTTPTTTTRIWAPHRRLRLHRATITTLRRARSTLSRRWMWSGSRSLTTRLLAALARFFVFLLMFLRLSRTRSCRAWRSTSSLRFLLPTGETLVDNSSSANCTGKSERWIGWRWNCIIHADMCQQKCRRPFAGIVETRLFAIALTSWTKKGEECSQEIINSSNCF